MIDWERVAELRGEIGPEGFAEVVEIFLDEVEEEIAALRAAVPDATLEAKLHFLKGSALNLGFRDFAELCQTGEMAAAHNDYCSIDLGATLETYERSRTAFLAGLST